MTNEALTTMMHTQPFQPFRIHLADGRSFVIDPPDFVARSRGGRTAVLYGDGEHFEIVDLMLVTSLERLNGEQRTSR